MDMIDIHENMEKSLEHFHNFCMQKLQDISEIVGSECYLHWELTWEQWGI
jgi:hypothetical protein